MKLVDKKVGEHDHHIIENHNGVRVRTNKTVRVTILEHAEYHRKYWEKWGFQEDRVAWLSLSEQLKYPELFIETSRIGGLNNKGIKKSEEHKKRISEANKGQRSHWLNGNSNQKKKNLSKSMTGNTNSKNHNTKKYSKTQSEAMKKAWIRRKEKEMYLGEVGR